MSEAGLLTTLTAHGRPTWSALRSASSILFPRRLLPSHHAPLNAVQADTVDPELRLPKTSSLVITIMWNVLSQTSFFIIVSSGSEYAKFLGGTDTFAGLVLGIPTVCSGLALIPLTRYDRGRYKLPLVFSCIAGVIGTALYGLAYRTHFLYLILISRLVLGLAFTSFLYTKRYITDARLVGARRRTTLAGWLVIGQCGGFSVGPFAGGLLYKIGFGNDIFNGYTSPGWVMAASWLVFTVVSIFWFEDVQPVRPLSSSSILLQPVPAGNLSKEQIAEIRRSFEEEPGRPTLDAVPEPLPDTTYRPSVAQWGVVATMCWFAMTCFFVLGGWEANIPIYAAQAFQSSPFRSGNLIALGGLCTFPFIFSNVLYARRFQDRYILATGSSIGLLGLLITIATLATGKMTYWALFVCWFLVALGFNLATTVTLSLLSKQMPHHWNGRMSMFIQYSNFAGRVTGAVWGGSGVTVGMLSYVGLQLAFLGIGFVMFMVLWRELKAKAG
ncbi:unnamed protein product [Peniophora sp. CBMAI 1063]|nr:unnamed protein product [Peniophora sp. CBMAI 1063]